MKVIIIIIIIIIVAGSAFGLLNHLSGIHSVDSDMKTTEVELCHNEWQ